MRELRQDRSHRADHQHREPNKDPIDQCTLRCRLEIDAECHNGSVRLTNVSGVVLADAHNGGIHLTANQILPAGERTAFVVSRETAPQTIFVGTLYKEEPANIAFDMVEVC